MAHDHCPHLDYRESSAGNEFERARAYCPAVGAFVEPMRADVCNARYGLAFETDCEFYEEPER
jgi:hypothetical protein